MARTMQAVGAGRPDGNVLVVVVDPLGVPRGHRQVKRGGVHQTARKPGRAKGKRQWRSEAASGEGPGRRAG
jgi:hypothetical protein